METDGPFSSEPSSSQPRGPDVDPPIFPSAIFDYHVQSWDSRESLASISRPYNQDDCHPKERIPIKFSQRYMSDVKKSLRERGLVQAASLNDVAKVNNLLNRGVNPNCSDSLSRTPLHIAACKGYAGIVRMLLERGANPNARDSIGNTALHLAACTNNIDVVLLLLKAGTDACSSDILGRSPLQLAQSKLKILQRAKFPNEEIKKQVSMVIEMVLHFSKASKRSSDVEALDLELLSNFQSRFKLTETRQDIDAQLSDLLDNLGSLTIKPA
uniref:Ankyrin repeat domain-containing protein 54 n=2 Tax=Lygus hesperus TaxID=30085 RepID=A0A0A9WBK5_LYGHE